MARAKTTSTSTPTIVIVSTPSKASKTPPPPAEVATPVPPPKPARKGKAAAEPAAAAALAVTVAPVTPPAATTARGKKAADDESIDLLTLIKTFTNTLRKRVTVAKAATADRALPADFTAGVEVKDVKALVKILNSLKNNVAPKAKGSSAPMNAFFYYQSLRHLHVTEKGLAPGETARVAELTKEHGGKLTNYMILSKLFNVDEYKKFDAKKKTELDITAKGFSLYRDERFPTDPAKDEAANKAAKSKALPSWVALKESERAGFEKRAKKVADDKQKEKAADLAAAVAKKEAKKKASEAKAALNAEAKKAKLAATAAVA